MNIPVKTTAAAPPPGLDPALLSGVLQNAGEVEAGVRRLAALGLPPCPDRVKSWDTAKAIELILAVCDRDAAVLDVGCANCPVLPMLWRRGYRRLYGCDLDGVAPAGPWKRRWQRWLRRPQLELSRQSLEQTDYPDAFFDVITSISVIEHNVNLDRYAREMARLLKPGGYLITSADYWETPLPELAGPPVPTPYNCPMHVFTAAELAGFFVRAAAEGLRAQAQFQPDCGERVISWNGARYTFAYFVLRKA